MHLVPGASMQRVGQSDRTIALLTDNFHVDKVTSLAVYAWTEALCRSQSKDFWCSSSSHTIPLKSCTCTHTCRLLRCHLPVLSPPPILLPRYVQSGALRRCLAWKRSCNQGTEPNFLPRPVTAVCLLLEYKWPFKLCHPALRQAVHPQPQMLL